MTGAVSLLSIGSGAIVGLVLGLVGGGGSILAVPLLVYLVGVSPAHVAIGTSALAVSVSAFANLVPHARAGNVKWRCASVFAASGVIGALAGAELAKAVAGDQLLVLFGGLMIIVGLLMLRRRGGEGDPDVRLTSDSARELLPLLVGIGFGVGALSGFFGIGGGFLIVPGLILATGMPLSFAIGTSLVAVGAFGAATAASYAVSGLIDWSVAALFVLGGLLGGVAGVGLGRLLASRKQILGLLFASIVVLVGIYVLGQGAMTLVDGSAGQGEASPETPRTHKEWRTRMSYYFAKALTSSFDDAVARATSALKEEGFGVITSIDLKETFKRKLDADFRPYTILGACNPNLAFEALKLEDKVGTMLPCNVIVQELGPGQVEVAAIDPVASMQAIGNPQLAEKAEAVREKLQSAIGRL